MGNSYAYHLKLLKCEEKKKHIDLCIEGWLVEESFSRGVAPVEKMDEMLAKWHCKMISTGGNTSKSNREEEEEITSKLNRSGFLKDIYCSYMSTSSNQSTEEHALFIFKR